VTEDELLERLLRRDESAFRALVERHHGMMLAFARGFVRDRAAAEEAVQETWVAVLEGLAGFERRSSLKTWIYAILANKARTAAVKAQRTVPFSAFGERDGPAVDADRFRADGHWRDGVEAWDDMDPERLMASAEIRLKLGQAIEALPGAQRAVLILRDVEGEDGATVAAMLDISEVNQRVLLHRARARLREALAGVLGRAAAPKM
jgi:RNA polymerase sigma-70 factor (ECF subfamily)